MIIKIVSIGVIVIIITKTTVIVAIFANAVTFSHEFRLICLPQTLGEYLTTDLSSSTCVEIEY